MVPNTKSVCRILRQTLLWKSVICWEGTWASLFERALWAFSENRSVQLWTQHSPSAWAGHPPCTWAQPWPLAQSTHASGSPSPSGCLEAEEQGMTMYNSVHLSKLALAGVRNWSWFPLDGHVVVTGLWDLLNFKVSWSETRSQIY